MGVYMCIFKYTFFCIYLDCPLGLHIIYYNLHGTFCAVVLNHYLFMFLLVFMYVFICFYILFDTSCFSKILCSWSNILVYLLYTLLYMLPCIQYISIDLYDFQADIRVSHCTYRDSLDLFCSKHRVVYPRELYNGLDWSRSSKGHDYFTFSASFDKLQLAFVKIVYLFTQG